MKRRKILLAGLVAVAVAGAMAWLVFPNQEPIYQGKRLSKWLDGNDSAGAERAVRQIGTNAFPTLLRMLRAHDNKLTLKLIDLAQKKHLIKFSFVAAKDRNSEARLAFRWLGADARNAVPDLIQIYEENISEASRRATAEALGHIGPAAAAAVPVLLHTATDTKADASARGDASWALGQLRAEPELVIPALIKCLKDPEPHVRNRAAWALMSFGSDAKPAVPGLIDLLKDPDHGVVGIAEQALKAIDPEAAAKAGVK